MRPLQGNMQEIIIVEDHEIERGRSTKDETRIIKIILGAAVIDYSSNQNQGNIG